MAKANPKTKPTAAPSKAVAVKRETLPSNVDAMLLMRQNAGKGISTNAADNIIPLIYILQAQSKQALKQKPEYIKGAEAGNIWPKGGTVLVNGDEGLPVICCGVRKFWTEWKPDRAGFAGKHVYDETDTVNFGRPSDTKTEKDPKTGYTKFVRESDNELVETREHAVLAYINDTWSPYVISMKGSDHTCAREWNGERLRQRYAPPNNDFVPPSFAFVYNLTTIAKSNDMGDWYGWKWEHGMGDGAKTDITTLENGAELAQMALSLHEAFMAGTKTAEAEEITIDNDDGAL